MRTLFAFLIVAAALFGSGEAYAADVARPPAFEVSALADAELDMVRGSGLTMGAMREMAQEQARGDFIGSATVARTVIDNWNNDVGAQLIANNIPIR